MIKQSSLYCALCFYVVDGPLTAEHQAVTIVSGHATCLAHMATLDGMPSVARALAHVRGAA